MKHLKECSSMSLDNFLCNTCQISKCHRLPFPDSTTNSLSPFDLLHLDLWRLYKNVSISGDSFVLTIVGDFARCTWTYLLHSKIQLFPTIVNFVVYVKNHCNTCPKTIRTDNGTEFVNSSCASFLASHEIIYQRSLPYSPQQNTVVERKHRYLLDTARSLQQHANLRSKF